MAPPPKKIEWEAPAYIFNKKSPDWFWAVGIITVTVFVVAVFLHNFLFGFFLILSGFSLALYGARPPEKVTFRIDERGVKIGKNIYEYDNIHRFWVNIDIPGEEKLLIESKKLFMPQITIPFGDADITKAKKILLRFIKEEKIEESLILAFARLIGF